MVSIAKKKLGKFSKTSQIKQQEYYSSSDENEELPDANENRLSDDSEYDLSDEDEDAANSAASGSEQDQQMEDETDAESSADESDAEMDSGDDQSQADQTEANENWAKSLAKILKQEKPKNKKSVVLSKAKKLGDILEAREQAKQIGFKIEGEIKEEKPDVDELDAAIVAEKKKKKKTKFELRIKPTLMDRERERAFKKIATKGVVQLFNAVRTQQKDLGQKLQAAGRLDHKRDAVLNNINKRQFLDVLMGGARAKSENVDNAVKEEEDDDMDDEVYNDGLPKDSIWSVLKEDFLSNKKLSHWDKDDESDEQKQTDQSDSDDE